MAKSKTKKTTADQLSAAIDKVLAEYGDNVKDNLDTITKEFAKKGAKAVKSASREAYGGTGKYANGWTSRFETGRVSSQGVIYNGAVPGLPHLLENGHAKRGGGRVAGRAHIAPVEAQLVEEYVKAVKQKL